MIEGVQEGTERKDRSPLPLLPLPFLLRQVKNLTKGSAQMTHSEGSSDVLVLHLGQLYPDTDSSCLFPL